MFRRLGLFIYRQRVMVLLVGLLFAVVSGVFGTSVFGSLKGGGFYDTNSESIRATDTITKQLGRNEVPLVVLFTSRDGLRVTDPAYKAAVEATLANVKGQPDVKSITSYYTTSSPALISNDKKSTYALVGLTGDEETYRNTLQNLRPRLTSPTLQVRLGGTPAVTEEINKQVASDLETAETMTFPILALLLVLIFGSLVAASLPLGIGVVAILGAFLVLKVASLFTDVSVFSVNVITMLGLGLAIDYSLFVVSRFREELVRQEGNVQGALAKTMQTAGRTVMFSGLTVAISLLSLTIFPQMFLRSMGMGGAAAVLVAMLSALTLLPAALAVLGPRVNSLSLWSLFRRGRKSSQASANSAQAAHGFWYRTSTFVMRYPTIVLVVTLVPLLLMGLPFLRVNLSVPDARSLPQGAESRVVTELLESEFPKNETNPIQIAVHTDMPALSAGGIDALYSYTRKLAAVPGVRRVDSLVNLDPRLDAASYKMFYSDAGLVDPRAKAAASYYSKGNFSVVSVVYDVESLSPESEKLVRDIRSIQLPAGLTAQVGGYSAYLVDFLAGMGNSIPWAVGLIVSVIFVLLFLMLGSIVVPLKAVILNILSLSVSFGALVWIFQDGNLSNLLNFTPVGAVDGTQPVLIFAIAFGLSMDYEVFLLSRIKEHYDRTGDTTASVAMGVQKTGAIITSAAALLVIVIGGFATGQVLVVKEIGIGLALAVLVDATLVRMLLVPATMRLLGRYNWWAPAPLLKLYHMAGMSEVEHEDTPLEVAPTRSASPVRKPEEMEAGI